MNNYCVEAHCQINLLLCACVTSLLFQQYNKNESIQSALELTDYFDATRRIADNVVSTITSLKFCGLRHHLVVYTLNACLLMTLLPIELNKR